MAPTGRAAKRMAESTGRSASTIHRRLGMNGMVPPETIEDEWCDHESMLSDDVVVIDEISMMDTRLAERVFSHIGENTRVVLVGDPHQLPPVGAGSVLLDLIKSERVPTTSLTQIFRQAEGSLLVVNAHRVKNGQEPYWTKDQAEKALGHALIDDWQWIDTSSSETAIDLTKELTISLGREMDLQEDEIMVTAPSRKGKCGIFALNEALQEQHNPTGTVIREGEQPLRTADRVMNIKNRYGKGENIDVMNGDLGVIVQRNEDGGIEVELRSLLLGNLTILSQPTPRLLTSSKAQKRLLSLLLFSLNPNRGCFRVISFIPLGHELKNDALLLGKKILYVKL
jgi:exodeoxyribonuclease V alpha subunit